MTEEEARGWLSDHFDVSRETWDRLEIYVRALLDGMEQQNLISESTRPHIWARHIVDSAQLLPLAQTADDGLWIDLGSGAGLPGVVIAILSDRPVLMMESRRKRVDFLREVIAMLGLRNAQLFPGRIETAPPQQAAIISARAYAPLPRLLSSARHLSDDHTLWVLPKGRNAEIELEAARPSWQGVFHVERSVTDEDSAIIVGHSVRPIFGRRKG
ncbi:MAG: 16S rRNA (guanine(527)-N(7))-methyltransferase RsmG [Sphingobium sp.]